MTPGAIMQWLRYLILILQYGKGVVDLAVDIYERIEYAAKARRIVHHDKMPSTEKAASFNRVFAAESSERNGCMPPARRVDAIREGVWRTRPQNRGRKPGTPK